MTRPMTGEALTRAMKKLGLSQAQFARQLSVNARTIRRKQNGESPISPAFAMAVQAMLREHNGKARP